MKVLSVENLNVEYRTKTSSSQILKNISINVEEGEFVALAGESGSGKTMTSLSCMNLLPENIQVTSGSINTYNSNISMIFQEPMTCLNPLMRVGRQIEEYGIARGMSKQEAHAKAVELARLTKLTDTERIFRCFPHELSGGMRQRVMIAGTLMNNPKLLIADEPTTALDVSTQLEILEILHELNKKYKTALLLITHDFSIVKKLCSRIYIMHRGEIIESGTAEKIFESPEHEYTKALLNAMPSFQKRNSKLPVYGIYE